MRSAFVISFVLALLVAHDTHAQRGGRNFSQQTAARYGWHSNYQRGLEEARAENNPVMLAFRCVP